jgi:hypothetical protein
MVKHLTCILEDLGSDLGQYRGYSDRSFVGFSVHTGKYRRV